MTWTIYIGLFFSKKVEFKVRNKLFGREQEKTCQFKVGVRGCQVFRSKFPILPRWAKLVELQF